MAGGYHAWAAHAGSFVWASVSDNTFATTGEGQFLIRASGGVGINLNDPGAYLLAVNGPAYFNGNVTAHDFLRFSDVRYKQNITTFDNALDAILKLRGVTYDWKRDTSGMNFADGRQIGFIAQEVEKVLPELVRTDSKGYKSVAYADIVPVLVEAMKSQQKQQQADKAEIAELRAKLDVLTIVVAELKANHK